MPSKIVSTLLEILVVIARFGSRIVIARFQPFLRFWVEPSYAVTHAYFDTRIVSTLLEILVALFAYGRGILPGTFQPFLRFWHVKTP